MLLGPDETVWQRLTRRGHEVDRAPLFIRGVECWARHELYVGFAHAVFVPGSTLNLARRWSSFTRPTRGP
jgi:hypothetical protein